MNYGSYYNNRYKINNLSRRDEKRRKIIGVINDHNLIMRADNITYKLLQNKPKTFWSKIVEFVLYFYFCTFYPINFVCIKKNRIIFLRFNNSKYLAAKNIDAELKYRNHHNLCLIIKKKNTRGRVTFDDELYLQ